MIHNLFLQNYISRNYQKFFIVISAITISLSIIFQIDSFPVVKLENSRLRENYGACLACDPNRIRSKLLTPPGKKIERERERERVVIYTDDKIQTAPFLEKIARRIVE